MTIPVSEMFYSLQGEGPYVGHPSVFLRLAGCSHHCGLASKAQISEAENIDEPQGDATWLCDTIEVWRKASWQPSIVELLDSWEGRGWKDVFRKGGGMREERSHLILTGGEPTLPSHQETMASFMDALVNSWGFRPYTEVETNGFFVPSTAFDDVVDHYNVSLKLSNSGMDWNDRINGDAIRFYANAEFSVFKFVISREEDVDEVNRLVDEFSIGTEQVWLMPAGASRSELEMTYPDVASVCKEEGWKFSPRLHVSIWDEATGV